MAAPLRDRLSFLSRLPVLLRGTADDDVPCPGYLFEEIAKISHESPGSSQCLLEYLLRRLQSSSCRVKLKVLKILLHTCAQGSPQFVLQLKRNACFIREAAVFTGPPDPLHGNSLNQKVRAAAQDLASILFSDTPLPQPAALPARSLPPVGMGSSPSPCSSLQGFGFSSEKNVSTSKGEALISTIQRAAEAVAHAVLPSPEGPRPCHRELHEDAYQPVRAPSPARSPAGTVKPPAATAAHSTRVSHQPGLAGGGWEEADSGHSSQDSSQGNGELSRTSDSCSKSGSDSQSGASQELAHVAERVDTDSLGDCVQEVSLVSALTRGARVFLTGEEAQHFVKECGLLNCEVVLELLGRALEDPSDTVRMRSMCAISSLMCSDLLSLEQILAGTRQHLQQLSHGSPGPVANRATKILRQFEALCSGQTPPTACPGAETRALALVSAPGTGDLLAGIAPLGSESILTPLSLASPPAAAETPAQRGAAGPGCICGGPGDTAGAAEPPRSPSLFAGMELVARPGAERGPPEPVPPQPRDARAGAGSRGQRSAFAFLNM